MMRIITGKARGVKLETLSGNNTRPTAERAKEAVFSMLQFDIEGRDVLDLFAGSGQLGLEAASRGAASVTLVDSSRDAVAIIKKNVEKTKLSDVCSVRCTAAEDYIKSASGRKKFDIVFIDPPYALHAVSNILSMLTEHGLLKSTSVVVCESEESDIFENSSELAEKFKIIRHSRYGIANVTVVSVADSEEKK